MTMLTTMIAMMTRGVAIVTDSKEGQRQRHRGHDHRRCIAEPPTTRWPPTQPVERLSLQAGAYTAPQVTIA